MMRCPAGLAPLAPTAPHRQFKAGLRRAGCRRAGPKAAVMSPNRSYSSLEEPEDQPSTSRPRSGELVAELGVPPHKLPQHVGIIMDGNSRWAVREGLAATLGHQAGVEALRQAVRCCKQWGIRCLTVYAFSAENWQRPEAEVAFLLQLLERVLTAELPGLAANGVRLRFLGELAMLPRSLQKEIARAELETGDNCDLHLNLAINYGGRQDLTAAVQEIARLVAAGQLRAAEVTPAVIASHLSTRQLPEALREPDLIIRTSGEQRLSNFLLWESAYSELYFSQALWPDFDTEEFAAALRDYTGRSRRYGGR